MNLLRCALITVMLCVLPALCAAQVYQWTDANGVKHFSNDPPPEGVQADQVQQEIQYDEAADRANNARNEEAQRSSEANRRQQEATDADANKAKVDQEAIDAKERELYDAGDTIVRKRRYLGRRGRQWIQEAQRLSEEIRELKKDSKANPYTISSKEAQLEDVKQRIYGAGINYRTRKGLGEDIQRYEDLDSELKQMKAAQEEPGAQEEKE